ncbi:MAG: hypothetical protein AABZ08_05670 [Planctomycetota bacterium]
MPTPGDDETNAPSTAPTPEAPTGVPRILDAIESEVSPAVLERREAIRPGASTWDQAFNQLQQRVSTLIESIETQSQTNELPSNVEPEPESDGIVDATLALETDREAERAELPLLVERIRARAEPAQNLSGILATLPELTAEHRQTLARVDHRLDLMKARTDATAEAITSLVREAEHVRAIVEEIRQGLTGCRQTEAELASNQRQMAESLNLLHDLVGRATETVKANAAWVEMLADSPDARYQTLRDQLTTQTTRTETKSNLTLIASAFAALVGVIAIVVALTR